MRGAGRVLRGARRGACLTRGAARGLWRGARPGFGWRAWPGFGWLGSGWAALRVRAGWQVVRWLWRAWRTLQVVRSSSRLSWWIRAWWLFWCTIDPLIHHEARINHGKS